MDYQLVELHTVEQQAIPSNIQDQETKFINNVILNKKELDIPPEESYSIINMDETPCFLEMGFNCTIDFTGNKQNEIESSGSEHYKISIILSVGGKLL